jgi:ATP-binding cassette subfamily B protein
LFRLHVAEKKIVMWAKYKTLWDALEGQRLRYILAIGVMIAGTLTAFVVPLVLRATIDSAIDTKPLDAPEFVRRLVDSIGGMKLVARNLWLPGLMMAALTLLAGTCGYTRGRLVAIASETTARRLRNRLYDHLQRLPAAYHDKADMGDLIQRCTSDVETVQGFLAGQIVEIGRALIMLAAVLVILLHLNWRMALLSTAVVPIVIGFSVIFFSRVRDAFKKADEAEGAMHTRLQENLTGIRVVRAFARQDFECEKFGEKNARFRDLRFRMIHLMAWYWSSTDFLTIAQGGVIVVAGTWWISRGQLSVGTLVAFMSYLGMFMWPVRQMGRILTEVGRTTVSLGRLQDILSVPREDPAAAAPGPAPGAPAPAAAHPPDGPAPLAGALAVKHLAFSHGGDGHALRDVSFTVQPGQTMAILGPSGSGKSTLVHLLLRFYDYQGGSIRIDGRELRDISRGEIRSGIGVVMQEPFLYSKTVRDNIRFGGTHAGDKEIEQAAMSACIHENILEFEQGYDTLVGERGVTLSGGQRQRVALARALLKDPPILILDDALSSVDTETETMILDALASRHRRRTTLVIAHRLSTLKAADFILVLDKGRVVQCGTHRELARQDGLYKRLWEIQGAVAATLRQEMGAG